MSRSLGTLTLDLIAKTGGFESGMDKAARIADKKTRAMERQARERARAMELAFTRMAAGVTAAWGALNVLGSVKQAADLADQLSKLSQRTGVAIESLSALNYAAGLNDATFDDMGEALKGLSNKMFEAASKGGEAAEAFDALGIRVTDSAGKLRSVDAVLLDIADAFSKMQDGAGKSAIANKLMEESGIRLIPTLNNGRAGLEGMRKEAEALGGIMGEDLAKASVELNDNLTRMDTLAQGLAASIGNAVIPKINELATEFLNARRAGLSFMEALVGIGLSNPTKSPAEHIAELSAALETLEKGKWYEKPLLDSLFPDLAPEQIRKELEYWKLMQQSMEGGKTPTMPAVTVTAPMLPSAPKTPKKSSSYTDPLADSAKAYAAALDTLNKAQLDADVSGLKLTATQSRLIEIMSSPEFFAMPESWRVMIAHQGEYALAAEQAAAEQQKLNDLLAATPTAQLEAQRATMQFLAQAFEQGKVSVEQYNEAVNAALGNTAPLEKMQQGLIDLSTVANDAARSMADAFTDFAMGVETDAGKMAEAFIADILRMIVQAQMLQAVQAAMGFFGVPMKFANGGAFDGGLQAFASGGVVNQPTFFKFASGGGFKNGLMGEAGPEAILPLKRGSDGKLGVSMNGSAGTNVNVVVHEAPGTRATVNQSPDGQGGLTLDIVIEQIEGKMASNLARGRSQIGSTLENVYGLNRAAGARR